MVEPAEPIWGAGDGAPVPGAGRAPYPSMKELQNMAACLNLGEDPSVCYLSWSWFMSPELPSSANSRVGIVK